MGEMYSLMGNQISCNWLPSLLINALIVFCYILGSIYIHQRMAAVNFPRILQRYTHPIQLCHLIYLWIILYIIHINNLRIPLWIHLHKLLYPLRTFALLSTKIVAVVEETRRSSMPNRTLRRSNHFWARLRRYVMLSAVELV